MSKPNLTAAGAATKMSELYALSTPALEAEAAAIKSDFKGWMDDNFTLTGAQTLFINGIASRTAEYYGDICSYAFLHRLDIDLVYPSPPSGSYGKWVESDDNTKASVDGNGDEEVTGSITFTVVYKQ